jgi:hypothetical protein
MGEGKKEKLPQSLVAGAVNLEDKVGQEEPVQIKIEEIKEEAEAQREHNEL